MSILTLLTRPPGHPSSEGSNHHCPLTTTEELPAYLRRYLKTFNDQLNQLRQELTTKYSSTRTNNTKNHSDQVQFQNHSGSITSERQHMENIQRAPTSNFTHELEVDFPQETEQMIQNSNNHAEPYNELPLFTCTPGHSSSERNKHHCTSEDHDEKFAAKNIFPSEKWPRRTRHSGNVVRFYHVSFFYR